ncbi:dockerin type I repeat-containing protein [Patescibacteria group bacterium]|nr:dockerin type I repeat-containing protein [Patescibacteria group bacterium]
MNQKGAAHILGLVLLIVGLVVAVYLVQQKTNLFPKAASAPIGCKTDSNCPRGYKCQIQATTLRECPSGVSNPACNAVAGKCVPIQVSKTAPSTKPSEPPFVVPTPAPIVCTACRADLNGDGQVNMSDFGRMLRCMGKKSTDSINGYFCSRADLNGDGQVNISDFNCIREQYMKNCQLGIGGPYNISMSDDPATIACKVGQTDCFFSTVVAKNKLDKSLYKTTIWNSRYSNVQFQGLNGQWNEPGSESQSDRVIKSGEGFSILVRLKSFSEIGIYNDVLYIDAQTCNLKTTPPDCYFYGATKIPFKITVN